MEIFLHIVGCYSLEFGKKVSLFLYVERNPHMAELASVSTCHFQQEIPIPQDVANLMVPGEQPVAAYATFRDSAIFTTKRLIVRDAQGLRGKKVEVYSLPY